MEWQSDWIQCQSDNIKIIWLFEVFDFLVASQRVDIVTSLKKHSVEIKVAYPGE